MTREMPIWNWLENLFQDVRYGLRQLRRNPGFTAVAILTFTLAIGATTSIFTLLYTVMLRPLPVKDPGQLILFQWHSHGRLNGAEYSGWGNCEDAPGMFVSGASTFWGCSFSSPMFDAFRSHTKSFDGLLAVGESGGIRAVIDDSIEARSAEVVSGDFFQVLGIRPALGRLIQPADDAPSAPAVVVLSYPYWQHAFGGSSSALGRTIQLDEFPFTIVGVSEPAFRSIAPGKSKDMWIARSVLPRIYGHAGWGALDDPSNVWLAVLGRLKPGVSRYQAQAEVSTIYHNELLGGSKPLSSPKDDPSVRLLPAQYALTGERTRYATTLYMLAFGVGVVLLIACANVGGLLLARSTRRHKEMAVRLVLGAGRYRVGRQLLTESVLLSASGGLTGILMAWWGTRALAGLLAGGSAQSFGFSLAPDARILAFVAGVSIFSGILAGFAPAFRGTGVDLSPALKDTGESLASALGGTRRFSAGNALVVAQVALTVVVLTGAGLFVRTLERLRAINPGFDTRNLLLLDVDPQVLGYTPPQIQSLYRQLQSELAATPGVLSVSCSGAALLDNSSLMSYFRIAGRPDLGQVQLRLLQVGPVFFRTMRIPVLAGREFEASDFAANETHGATPSDPIPRSSSKADQTAPPRSSPNADQTVPSPLPVVVNQAFVREYFPHRNPLGARLTGGQVVGVVADTKYDSLKSAIQPVVYFPLSSEDATFELRTAHDPKTVVSLVRAIVARADHNLPIRIRMQTETIDLQLQNELLTARLSTLFAALALLLACIGLYGLLAYNVAGRTREIGIRMALGAQRRDVLRLTLGRGATPALIGIALGLAGAFGLTRFLRSMLFELTPTDPVTFFGVSILLLLSALAACYIPARRATKVDPMIALRHE